MASAGGITGASTMMVVAWLEERQGTGMVDTLFQRLRSTRGHQVTRDQFSLTRKVDYRLHVDVLEEVAQLTGASDETLREIGAAGAQKVEDVVPGASMMLKFASPKRILKHAPRLWRTYADFGQVEVLERSNGHAKLRISGFETHPHFCRTLEGFFEGMIERVGGKDVAVRELTHAETEDGCVFEGTWS